MQTTYASFPKSSLVDDKGDGRVDLVLGPKTTAFGRYSDHEGNIVDITTIPGPDGGSAGNGTLHAYNRQIVGGVTRTVSPNSVLDARVGFTWTEGGKTPYEAGVASLNTQAGIPGLPTDSTVIRALSSENVTGFTAWGAQSSNPQFQNPFVVNPKVNYSIQQGRNSIKVGWEFLAINTEIDDFNPVYGAEAFAGAFSQCVATTAGVTTNQCNGTATTVNADRCWSNAGGQPGGLSGGCTLRLPAQQLCDCELPPGHELLLRAGRLQAAA